MKPILWLASFVALLASGCAFIDDFSRFTFGDAGPLPDGGPRPDTGPRPDGAPPETDGGGPSGPELSGVTDIGVGATHACAVRTGGELVCWGSNTCGELGVVGAPERNPRPVVVMTSGVTQVVGGVDVTCALLATGEVWCWGDNFFGQLGDGTEVARTTPQPVIGVSGATAISAGDDNVCAVVAGGAAKCWGSNLQNELGSGSGDSWSSTPQDVAGLTGVVRLAAADNHACAVDGGGTLRCWGIDNYGQLGTNDGDHPTPVVVPLTNVTDVSGAVEHTCAIHDGSLSCWGSNEVSQLARAGGGTFPTPQAVALEEAPTRIAESARARHTCVISASTKVWCWGESNLLGAGVMDLPTGRPIPIEAEGLTDAVEVSAGPQATCARLASGVVRCWGYNAWGQLGDGTRTDRFVPGAVLSVE